MAGWSGCLGSRVDPSRSVEPPRGRPAVVFGSDRRSGIDVDSDSRFRHSLPIIDIRHACRGRLARRAESAIAVTLPLQRRNERTLHAIG
jgi:hypothetical protein